MVGDDYETLKGFAIMLTIAVLGSMLLWLMSRGVSLQRKHVYLLILCWSVWTVLLFLPAMHERYSFMLDILLIVLSVYRRKYIGFAVLQEVTSAITYGRYLFGNSEIPIATLAVAYTAGYMLFSFLLWKEMTAEFRRPACFPAGDSKTGR